MTRSGVDAYVWRPDDMQSGPVPDERTDKEAAIYGDSGGCFLRANPVDFDLVENRAR